MATIENLRWWSCPRCEAVNDGEDDKSRCWNCGYILRVRSQAKVPWVTLGKTKCSECGMSYVTVRTPLEPEIELGFCPFYFEHYGNNAYTSPVLPSLYVLRLNGYEYDEARNKVVKAKR